MSRPAASVTVAPSTSPESSKRAAPERTLCLYQDVFGRDAELECTRMRVTSPDRDIPHLERFKHAKVTTKTPLSVGLRRLSFYIVGCPKYRIKMQCFGTHNVRSRLNPAAQPQPIKTVGKASASVFRYTRSITVEAIDVGTGGLHYCWRWQRRLRFGESNFRRRGPLGSST